NEQGTAIGKYAIAPAGDGLVLLKPFCNIGIGESAYARGRYRAPGILYMRQSMRFHSELDHLSSRCGVGCRAERASDRDGSAQAACSKGSNLGGHINIADAARSKYDCLARKHLIHSTDQCVSRLPNDGNASLWIETFKQLALGSDDVFESSERPQVSRAHIDDDTDVRKRRAGQQGDLSEPAHGHLNDKRSCVIRHGQNRLRHTELIVFVHSRTMSRHRGAKCCCAHFFRSCLSRRAGYCDHERIDALAPIPGQVVISLESIADSNERKCGAGYRIASTFGY